MFLTVIIFFTYITARKVFVFGVILVRIFPHSDWIRTWITPNTDTIYAVHLMSKINFIWTRNKLVNFYFLLWKQKKISELWKHFIAKTKLWKVQYRKKKVNGGIFIVIVLSMICRHHASKFCGLQPSGF